MSKPVFKLDHKIRDALDDSGLPYDLAAGSRHIKMTLGGKFIGVLSYTSRQGTRDIKNTIARIRKAAKELNE